MNRDQATAHFQLLNTVNSYLRSVSSFAIFVFVHVPKYIVREAFFCLLAVHVLANQICADKSRDLINLEFVFHVP